MQPNLPFPTVAPNSRQILLPCLISSVHGMICRRTRLVLYTRNSKVFWKIMPYYNPPATKKQRICRDAFGEASKFTAKDLKYNTPYWTKMAEIKHYNSAHQAAFKFYYHKAEAEIKKLNRITNNAIKRLTRTTITIPRRHTATTPQLPIAYPKCRTTLKRHLHVQRPYLSLGMSSISTYFT